MQKPNARKERGSNRNAKVVWDEEVLFKYLVNP